MRLKPSPTITILIRKPTRPTEAAVVEATSNRPTNPAITPVNQLRTMTPATISVHSKRLPKADNILAETPRATSPSVVVGSAVAVADAATTPETVISIKAATTEVRIIKRTVDIIVAMDIARINTESSSNKSLKNNTILKMKKNPKLTRMTMSR